MEELSERQKLVLSLIIHEYIQSAQPIGSSTLVQKYRLEFSPATVRNEMAELTEKGYLGQPHTSAGRVPTVKGYRNFVSSLMRVQELPSETQRMIEHQFSQAQQGTDGWIKLAASILASQSKAVSMVSIPTPQHMTFKNLALIRVSGKQVLMVLVLDGGQLNQRFLYLNEKTTQEELNGIVNEINTRFAGKTAEQIHESQGSAVQQDDLMDLVRRNLVNAMFEMDSQQSGEVYTDGVGNVLAEPEFAESEEARKALNVLSEQPTLQSLFSNAAAGQKVGGVQVYIGGEGILSHLHDCSMILARYGMPGVATGMIGLFGPMRMAYNRNIPTVRFMAGLLSDLVSDSFSE